MEVKQKTDLENANAALAAMKPNVTTTDRKECGLSAPMIVQYLNGQGADLDTAVRLLEFFRERINRRRKVIAK